MDVTSSFAHPPSPPARLRIPGEAAPDALGDSQKHGRSNSPDYQAGFLTREGARCRICHKANKREGRARESPTYASSSPTDGSLTSSSPLERTYSPNSWHPGILTSAPPRTSYNATTPPNSGLSPAHRLDSSYSPAPKKPRQEQPRDAFRPKQPGASDSPFGGHLLLAVPLPAFHASNHAFPAGTVSDDCGAFPDLSAGGRRDLIHDLEPLRIVDLQPREDELYCNDDDYDSVHNPRRNLSLLARQPSGGEKHQLLPGGRWLVT